MGWLQNIHLNVPTVAVPDVTILFMLAIARYALIPRFAAKRRERMLDTRLWDGMIKALEPDWRSSPYQ